MREKKGILIVVSGFSGAGKGTLMKKLMQDYDNYALSISATTRQPRVGEEDGREYFFRTKEEFEKMIARDELIEYARYVENYYGTPKQYVMEQLEAGKDVILEIEQQGAFAVKKAVPEAILIFLTPPTIEELERRLRNRKTESDDVIASRLAQACAEAAHVDQYDYIVINDEVEHCVDAVNRLIETEHQRTQFNGAKIQELQRDLQPYRKGE